MFWKKVIKELVQLTEASMGHSVLLMLEQESVTELHCTHFRDSTHTTASVAVITIVRMIFMALELKFSKDEYLATESQTHWISPRD